jgi:hypothetical protein
MIIFRSFLRRMEHVSDKSYGEIQNTHFVFSIFLNSYLYEIMWKNIVEPGTPRDNMGYAHCILDT